MLCYNILMYDDKEKLCIYVAELLKWNKSFNLIGKSTEEDIWKIHIEDSLSLLPYLEKENCINIVDIGCGAGLPSIPLSIMLPEKIFYLTEVNTKKLAFLTFITKKLNLNTKVIDINNGFYLEEECIVISRAFSSIKNIIKWENTHLLKPVKTILLKGLKEKIEEELKEALVKEFDIIKSSKGNIIIF